MSFRVYRGKVKQDWLPMTTSLALSKDILVEFTSGLIAEADDNDTAIAGIMVKAITASDSDYATARQVPIIVPMERHVVYEADATGFSASDIGGEFGISDSGTVDQSDTTNKVFLVTEVLSATKVRGYMKINQSY